MSPGLVHAKTSSSERGGMHVGGVGPQKIFRRKNYAHLLSPFGWRGSFPSGQYWMLLGTEYPFEHVTTADKFIYEAELRTGLGAHFRYAKHLRDVLALWYEKFPATRKLILEGDAEPE